MKFVRFVEHSWGIVAEFSSRGEPTYYFIKESLELRLANLIKGGYPHREEKRVLDQWPKKV